VTHNIGSKVEPNHPAVATCTKLKQQYVITKKIQRAIKEF